MVEPDNGSGAPVKSCSELSSCESSGGVSVNEFLGLIRALIGCGVSPDVAAQSATAVFANQPCGQPASEKSRSEKGLSRSERSFIRQREWQAKASVLPYEEGLCYLHPVRWGKREYYKRMLGSTPTLRKFVEMLEPGDLNESVAHEMSVYRVGDLNAYGSDIVYHFALDCDAGERIASVYEVLANFTHRYPWVSCKYEFKTEIDLEIPVVGVVGSLRSAAPVDVRLTTEPVDGVVGLGIRCDTSLLTQARAVVDGGRATPVFIVQEEPTSMRLHRRRDGWRVVRNPGYRVLYVPAFVTFEVGDYSFATDVRGCLLVMTAGSEYAVPDQAYLQCRSESILYHQYNALVGSVKQYTDHAAGLLLRDNVWAGVVSDSVSVGTTPVLSNCFYDIALAGAATAVVRLAAVCGAVSISGLILRESQSVTIFAGSFDGTDRLSSRVPLWTLNQRTILDITSVMRGSEMIGLEDSDDSSD